MVDVDAGALRVPIFGDGVLRIVVVVVVDVVDGELQVAE